MYGYGALGFRSYACANEKVGTCSGRLPAYEWSDVGHDTRVRMKTLVAETMDIFERKYKKLKVWEWERKVQKYRPPGTNKTFNVPLGNVVRGIQEAYFIFNPDERPEGCGGG